jgi:hypothetical protein
MRDEANQMRSVAQGTEALASTVPYARARLLLLAVLALAGGLFPALPACGAGTRTVEIEVRNGKVVGKNSTRVIRGDTVQLRWSSDKALELHLHGYDVTIQVGPGMPAEMNFRAHATGRFPVEIHGKKSGGGHSHGHKSIYYLEVYPD